MLGTTDIHSGALAIFAGILTRLEGLSIWIARPALVDAAFNTFIWPLLGIIFFPFATLIYVALYTPGIELTGWEWFWLILAGLFDIGQWVTSYRQRDQVPGMERGG